jgi:hypothetical protein
MAEKKFNSLFDISVSLFHGERDGSDLTVGELREAFERRLVDLRQMGDAEFSNCVGGPYDTEKED